MDYLEEYFNQFFARSYSSILKVQDVKHWSNEEFVNHIERDTSPGSSYGTGHLLKLCTNESYGRHAVSDCDIKAGDIVLYEKPFILAPNVCSPFSKAKPICLGCLDVTWSECYCPECGYFFCNDKCIQEGHKEECEILSRLNLIQGHTDIELMRKKIKLAVNEEILEENKLVAQKIAKQAVQSSYLVHRTTIMKHYPCISVLRTLIYFHKNPFAKSVVLSLQANSDQNKRQYLANKHRIVDVIRNDLKYCQDSEFLHQVAGIWDTNGFEVQLGTGTKIQGLYLGASLLTHSCKPNLEQWFTTTGNMIMRSLEDISCNEILTICYTESLWPTRMRIDHLRLTKQFSCSCERCSDKTELQTYLGSVRCPDCNSFLMPDSSLDPTTDWYCLRDCDRGRFSAKQLVLKDAANAKIFGEVRLRNLEQVRETLSEAQKQFHPSYHLLLRLQLAVVDAYASKNFQDLNEDDFRVVEEATRVSHDTIRLLYPRYNRHRARVTRVFLRIILERIRRNEPYGKEENSSNVAAVNSREKMQELLEDTRIVLGWDRRMPPMDQIEHDFENLVRSHW